MPGRCNRKRFSTILQTQTTEGSRLAMPASQLTCVGHEYRIAGGECTFPGLYPPTRQPDAQGLLCGLAPQGHQRRHYSKDRTGENGNPERTGPQSARYPPTHSSTCRRWPNSPLRVNLVSREPTQTQFAAKAVLRPLAEVTHPNLT
jgi:hypothetical protein